MSELEDKRLDAARGLADEIESLEGIEKASVDDYTSNVSEVSFFATPKDDANLHSVSQLVKNILEENEMFNIQYFNTPSETRRNWYDFDMTVF